MNRKAIFCCLTACALLASTQVFSQDKDDKAGGDDKVAGHGGMDPAAMAEMMKKCAAAGQPGEHHKLLAKCVGEWDTVAKMWMDPSAPPSETKGKTRCKMILDGRFIVDEMESEMMIPNEKGQMDKVPFKGMGMTGYDNVKQLYTGTWIDSMGTGILTMTGSYNPQNKTLNMYGHMDDIAMGIYGKSIRYETKFVSDTKHVFTMYDLHAGPDYKVMEVTYTRAKGGTSD